MPLRCTSSRTARATTPAPCLSVFKGEDAEYVGSAELFDIDVNFTKIDRVRMETENLYYDTNLRDGDESDYVFFDEVFLADSYGEISVGGDYGDMGAIPEPTSSALILAAGTVLFVTTDSCAGRRDLITRTRINRHFPQHTAGVKRRRLFFAVVASNFFLRKFAYLDVSIMGRSFFS